MKKCLVSFAILTFSFGLFSGCSDRTQELQRYEVKAQGLGELMTQQAYACVSQSKAYQAVWEYAKVSEIDFETAAAQMLGAETKQNKAMMIEHKSMIEKLLEELKNPPSQFEVTYKKLSELYEIYVQLHDLAMDPLDDMEKHMDSVNELSDKIAEIKRELDATFVLR
jgi:transposase